MLLDRSNYAFVRKGKIFCIQMSQEEFEFLTRDKIRKLIEAHKEADPIQFALTHHNNAFPVHLVSQQLKSLQKARRKLPLWYRHNAILPERALEQASSARTASLKKYQGKRLLDLSAGLGVDSYYLSQGFETCIALEPDPVLAQVSRYNFALLGNERIAVKNLSAEQFLTEYEGPAFDLIYVDPSRRDERGKRLYALEDCAPNVFALLPKLREIGRRLLIKVSPLFDLKEAHRLFPSCKELHVISVDNECKELLIDLDLLSAEGQSETTNLKLAWIRKGEHGSFSTRYPVETNYVPANDELPLFLLEPDVAVYKADIAPHFFTSRYPGHAGGMNHQQGYFFSSQAIEGFPGRQFSVLESMPFKPKGIRKWLKEKGIRQANLSKRYFPLAIKAIRKQLGVREGGDIFLLFTLWQGKRYVFVSEIINNQ
jgi:hypothetical protein